MSFDGFYNDWNQVRIKALIEYYGHQFFFGKKILDLGCGHGDISGVLYRLGSDVMAVDARQEHLKIVGQKYNGVKTIKADLDRGWPFFGKRFDLTLDLGLLCHLQNFEEHLKAVCFSSNALVLETAVLDSNDPNACIVKLDGKGVYDSTFNGFSSQVSSANIERVLKANGMSFKRIDTTKFNSGPYSYDWQSQNNDAFSINKRRIWFCVKDNVQAQPTNQPPIPLVPQAGLFSSMQVSPKLPLTRSPQPPGYNQAVTQGQLAAGSYIMPQSSSINASTTSNKIRLFYNYYEDKNPQRAAEIDFCFQKNIDNNHFDLIIIGSDTNPTFDFMFDKINKLAGPDDISIICNADIFFDETISLANKLGPKDVFALSRWDWKKMGTVSFSNKDSDQDTWIVRGKVENVAGNFRMGKPGCDGRIAFEFKKAGYNISNPSRSIMTYHYHNSQIRNYTEADRIIGDYLAVPIMNL